MPFKLVYRTCSILYNIVAIPQNRSTHSDLNCVPQGGRHHGITSHVPYMVSVTFSVYALALGDYKRVILRIVVMFTLSSYVMALLRCVSKLRIHLLHLLRNYEHSKIIMLYRIRHQLANVPTTNYITPATRNTQHYNLPYARTEVYKSSFFPSTIKLWNNLQPAIINSTTIPQLRQALQSTPTSGRRGATLSA